MEKEKFEQIPVQSPLLDDAMKGQIAGVLEKLAQDIWVYSVVDMADSKCREMAQFLKSYTGISRKVHLELLEPGEDAELEEKLECGGLYPVTGLFLAGKCFTGISFRGIPGGREINSFVIAFYNAAGPGQPLEAAALERIQALPAGHTLQVFVSLSCHFCAENVILAQHIAALRPGLHVQMTDAGLYPALVQRYGLERVPVMLLDGERRLTGGRSMEELLDFLENADK